MTLSTRRLIALGLLLTGCASSEPPRAERSSASLSGAKIAFPMALALTGMASAADGTIKVSTIGDAAKSQFDRFDVDGSQTLSTFEHAAWADAMLGDRNARPTWLMLDRDGRGGLSRDEFGDALKRAAQRYDKNQDGVITRSELLIQMPERGDRAKGRGQGGGQDGQRGPRPQR